MAATTIARTMTARYAGKCRTCEGRILPGDEILYAGRGLTYHVGECADHHTAGATPAPTSGRRRYGSRSSGWDRPRGRCEDAPCCGCCGTSSYYDGGY